MTETICINDLPEDQKEKLVTYLKQALWVHIETQYASMFDQMIQRSGHIPIVFDSVFTLETQMRVPADIFWSILGITEMEKEKDKEDKP
jgi:hypothetical protein